MKLKTCHWLHGKALNLSFIYFTPKSNLSVNLPLIIFPESYYFSLSELLSPGFHTSPGPSHHYYPIIVIDSCLFSLPLHHSSCSPHYSYGNHSFAPHTLMAFHLIQIKHPSSYDNVQSLTRCPSASPTLPLRPHLLFLPL